MVLLEACPPTGGCFTLWPTSHHKLFPLFTTSQGNFPKETTHFSTLGPGGYMSSQTVKQTLVAIAATGQPMEFDDRAGDACFWHHRLAHSASPNRLRQHIRLMLVCDFQKYSAPAQTRTCYDDHTLGRWNKSTQCQEQFHSDTRKFREDEPPGPAHMWKDWAN